MHRILEGVIRRPVAGRRVAFSGLVLGIVISLVSAGVAFADELVVDGDGLVPVNANVMNLPGAICIGDEASGPALLAIRRTAGGQGGGPSLQNVFSNGSTPTVSATPSHADVSAVFSDSGIALPGNWTAQANTSVSADTASSTVTVEGAEPTGARSATVLYRATGTRASDNGALIREATLTVNWTVIECAPPPPPADTTPPVIEANVTGTLGANSWYTSDVTVTWTVSDDESDITSMSGCDEELVNYDTAGVTFTCVATSEGGDASKSVPIKRDATPPDVSASRSPDANGFGWNNSAVTVSFSGTDDTSGIDSCDADVVLAGEGANQEATGSCTDNAGNSASDTVSDINIDLTPPAPSLVGGPVHGGVYYVGSVPAPGCAASDSPSGVDTCIVEGFSADIGTHTIKATATDKAGNSASSASISYTVYWTVSGFYRPVDMGYLNTVKGGSTVPLKFEAFAGATELTDIGVVKSLTAVQTSCSTSMETAPVEELAATGGTLLRYDWTDGQFVFNWKTPKMPGKCYRVTLMFQDGSSIVANFSLK